MGKIKVYLNKALRYFADGRSLSYEYDAEERITKVLESDGETFVSTTSYTYDAQGQLLTETVNGNLVNQMFYDAYGNIRVKNGKEYKYGDRAWKDLLTTYDGQTITYDLQGNPTNYLGHTLAWEKGRQLKSFDSNTYTYNANGIRTSKTIDGVKRTYTLDGAKILRETWGINELIPLYDNEDSVCGVIYNEHPFYFRKNLQGDVIAITDWAGLTVARYSYDTWGKCTIVDLANTHEIAEINPFRYRGYYYDAEIQMYYLQSRYYDPEIGRFLNGDKVMGANDGVSTYVLYTYCGNCPVDRYDSGGFCWKKIWNGVKNAVRKTLNMGNKVLVWIGIDTAAWGAFFLNMTKDHKGIYHANFNCWQQYFGYNDFYDFMFDIGTSMKNRKFEFKSGKTWYVLWAWKGNYINLGAGAELGIYYCKYFNGPHWWVDKDLAMDMSMKLKYKGSTIINYSARTWWLTGFNPNSKYYDVKASDLKVSFEVRFRRKDLYTAFKKKYKGVWTFPDEPMAKFTF